MLGPQESGFANLLVLVLLLLLPPLPLPPRAATASFPSPLSLGTFSRRAGGAWLPLRRRRRLGRRQPRPPRDAGGVPDVVGVFHVAGQAVALDGAHDAVGGDDLKQTNKKTSKRGGFPNENYLLLQHDFTKSLSSAGGIDRYLMSPFRPSLLGAARGRAGPRPPPSQSNSGREEGEEHPPRGTPRNDSCVHFRRGRLPEADGPGVFTSHC